MPISITDRLDANIIIIVRQALNGEIDSGQAMRRVRHAQRLAQIARYQVPIVKGETKWNSRKQPKNKRS